MGQLIKRSLSEEPEGETERKELKQDGADMEVRIDPENGQIEIRRDTGLVLYVRPSTLSFGQVTRFERLLEALEHYRFNTFQSRFVVAGLKSAFLHRLAEDDWFIQNHQRFAYRRFMLETDTNCVPHGMLFPRERLNKDIINLDNVFHLVVLIAHYYLPGVSYRFFEHMHAILLLKTTNQAIMNMYVHIICLLGPLEHLDLTYWMQTLFNNGCIYQFREKVHRFIDSARARHDAGFQ